LGPEVAGAMINFKTKIILMKKITLFAAILGIVFFYACSGGDKKNTNSKPTKKVKTEKPDDGKGVGGITNVELNDPLNAAMVEDGKGIYELKCAACHKLSDQRVVGPGWAGITDRRKPEWIMNMTLNIDVMLEEDKVARDMLKECLVRMPNQNLTEADGRAVLEFMYENDK